MSIMGIDPSVRATAWVVLPADWHGQPDVVLSQCLACSETRKDGENARVLALDDVARGVASAAAAHGVSHAWIESYGYSRGASGHGAQLAELGGLLRLRLAMAGVQVDVANMGSARKLLLGKVPRGKGAAKVAAKGALEAAGLRFGTLDEVDAFVCANWGMSELGMYTLAQAAR